MAGAGDLRQVYFEAVDSTNAEAMRRAAAGERGALWIVAGRQTAGRGRQGRVWESSPGNLYATFLSTWPVAPDVAAQASFAAALAVFETAATVLPEPAGLALKWPNDVLLDARKLSGILIESVAQDRPDRTTLAIGIGLNLARTPAATRYGATSLAEHGAALEPAAALPILAAALDRWLGVWNAGRGFAVIRREWTARAAGLGRTVTVTLGGRTVSGAFHGLAGDGALLLAEPDGRVHAVHAGDVSLSWQAAGPAEAP